MRDVESLDMSSAKGPVSKARGFRGLQGGSCCCGWLVVREIKWGGPLRVQRCAEPEISGQKSSVMLACSLAKRLS